MGRRSHSHEAIATAAAAREDLERRWGARLTREPALATLVTAESAAHEPFHRWMRYKQGFSPALVRLFLKETESSLKKASSQPVLDPYSGSGTSVVECSRHGIAATAGE